MCAVPLSDKVASSVKFSEQRAAKTTTHRRSVLAVNDRMSLRFALAETPHLLDRQGSRPIDYQPRAGASASAKTAVRLTKGSAARPRSSWLRHAAHGL